ncbi:hypothetical protein BH09VER1_BH09VER1_37930 [soil metagenome]
MEEDLETAVINERHKLAKILHDGLCQHLTGVTLLTQVLVGRLTAEQHPLSPDAEKIRDLVKAAADDLHTVMAALRSA